MSGRIIAEGPHRCEPSGTFAIRGDIWRCDVCGRTWRCAYNVAGSAQWYREMPWSRWRRARRQRRIDLMRETGSDE